MKKYIRMILDIVLLCLMLTLFDKRFIGMKYHELSGIFVCLLLVLHIGINAKVFCTLKKNFAKISLTWKLCFIFDILLILCFLYLLISGILCSHALFPPILKDSTFFKLSHITMGAVSVVLLGFHIGLHLCKKQFPLVPTAILSILITVGAVWGLATSNQTKWLSIPFSFFTAKDVAKNETGQMQAQSDSLQAVEQEHDHTEERMPQGQGKGKGGGKGLKKGEGGGKGTGPKNILPLTVKQKMKVVLQFFCMIAFPIVLCYWLSFLTKNIRKMKCQCFARRKNRLQ